MIYRRILSLCLLALLPIGAEAQQYYRWVDADGVSHFSQNPPPSDIEAERALLPRTSPVNASATAVPEEQAASASSGETLNSFGKDPDLCSQVLQSLQTMNEYENIVMTDPDTGDGVYLSESERAAEKVRLENMRSYYCE
jgi:hypothetical protein